MKTPIKIALAIGAAIGAGYLFKMSNKPASVATTEVDDSYKGLPKVEIGEITGKPNAEIAASKGHDLPSNQMIFNSESFEFGANTLTTNQSSPLAY